jgi:hypothetical protein
MNSPRTGKSDIKRLLELELLKFPLSREERAASDPWYCTGSVAILKWIYHQQGLS